MFPTAALFSMTLKEEREGSQRFFVSCQRKEIVSSVVDLLSIWINFIGDQLIVIIDHRTYLIAYLDKDHKDKNILPHWCCEQK